MSDFIIIDGDQAMFQPNFGKAMVAVRPGRMKGSGKSTWRKKKICIGGDEKSIHIPGCLYFTPDFPAPGTGTLKIKALAGNQLAKKAFSKGKAMILRGGIFEAVFEVQSPAKNPPAQTQDTAAKYSGKGNFLTTNTTYRAG